MADITPFLFENETLVRVVQRDGEPWFVARDVCNVLGIVWKGSESTGPLSSMDDDEKGVALTDTPGGPQEMVVINESGLYALVFRSRKPAAHRFRKWITAEVIPAIRKTGGYGTLPQGSAGAVDHRLVEVLSKAIQAQDALIRWTHGAVTREHRARVTRILIAETSLSDQEIADRLGDLLIDPMPEYVAYHRRKLAEESA